MTVQMVGPLEHLIGQRFRSRREPVMEGVLHGIGCGYFIVLTNCRRECSSTKIEVTANRLANSWDQVPK